MPVFHSVLKCIQTLITMSLFYYLCDVTDAWFVNLNYFMGIFSKRKLSSGNYVM